MGERTWDDFLSFLYKMPSTLNPGRQSIRVVRDNLNNLVAQKVLPYLSTEDHARFFPLGFSPNESDLKIASGVALERSLIEPQEYEQALREDKKAGPFGFLQTLSGKAFGETVAPKIAEYWLSAEGDSFAKLPNTDLYDFAFTPKEVDRPIRVELKASSQEPPNFQQIRDPKMTNKSALTNEYDVLLCISVANTGLRWWIIPADDIPQLINDGFITLQHGGQKTDSGVYWVQMDKRRTPRMVKYESTSEELRMKLILLTTRS